MHHAQHVDLVLKHYVETIIIVLIIRVASNFDRTWKHYLENAIITLSLLNSLSNIGTVISMSQE